MPIEYIALKVFGLFGWLRKLWKERKSDQTAHAKDRPRFRVDVTKVETTHPAQPAFIVEIFSLGSLPLTINKGDVFITSNDYPEHVQAKKLDGCEIGTSCPIKITFLLAHKFTNPLSGGKPTIEMVCKFSYGVDKPYEKKWVYNHRIAQFEEAHLVTPIRHDVNK